VFENRVLRKTSGPNKDEVTGECRRLQNRKLRTIYHQILFGQSNHLARIGDRTGAYRNLVGRHEGNKPLGRPRRRREENIKMDLQELGYGAWTGLIRLRTGTGDRYL
jgi:hypothetical protein